MSTVEQLQVVVSEVQNARHQVATVRAQLQELETTIAAVEKHPEGMALHRQLGGVLVEVDNKAELVEELKTTHSTFPSMLSDSPSMKQNLSLPMKNSRNHLREKLDLTTRRHCCNEAMARCCH